MIDGLKPYPAYKDSGVEWLEKAPEHWDLFTLRRKLQEYEGIEIGPFGSQLKLDQMSTSGYKVYGQANVIATDFARGSKFVSRAKFDELSACSVLPGDLLVTMMGTSGRCAVVPNGVTPGIMDSHLLRLRTSADLITGFVAVVLDRAPYMKHQFATAGKGSIMHGLNSNVVKNLFLTLPPVSEQSAILRYLKQVDKRMACCIYAKQKLIKLLQEQKQAFIHGAVTRGIDPNVRLKRSGVEWLGDVPEHLEIARLSQFFTLFTLQRGFDITKDQQSEGTVPVVSSGGISSCHNRGMATGQVCSWAGRAPRAPFTTSPQIIGRTTLRSGLTTLKTVIRSSFTSCSLHLTSKGSTPDPRTLQDSPLKLSAPRSWALKCSGGSKTREDKNTEEQTHAKGSK